MTCRHPKGNVIWNHEKARAVASCPDCGQSVTRRSSADALSALFAWALKGGLTRHDSTSTPGRKKQPAHAVSAP